MALTTIENPILNSPFAEPTRHFRTDGDGAISPHVLQGRRVAEYVVPVAQPRRTVSPQATLDLDSSSGRREELKTVNDIRSGVARWRRGGYEHATAVSRMLLDYWQRPDRERRLFFCQIEALETLIYLAEAAPKNQDRGVLGRIHEDLLAAGTTLPRLACKMATGSGKTLVMAMIVAWQTLNARRDPKRYSAAFLAVAPGITIRERLRVLKPSDAGNDYDHHDLVPPECRADLAAARVAIVNYHAFQLRKKQDVGRLNQAVLARGRDPAAADPFFESPPEMVRRVLRDLDNARNLVVFNDEAHHCYRSRAVEAEERLTGDDRKEAEENRKAARLWLTGLESIAAKNGVRTVYDLSATPFYLKGSGWGEGKLFPWVVSDFSLIDAIESGIVKIPRVPIADNSLDADAPKYRRLWDHVSEDLPGTRSRKDQADREAWTPPGVLEGAVRALYSAYDKEHQSWAGDGRSEVEGRTPPVFIVVCNNTTVSKSMFDWIAGRETGNDHVDGAPEVAAGKLALFDNTQNKRWRAHPRTILVDSAQLESGEPLPPEFRRANKGLIDEYKADYRRRQPGGDAEKLDDGDILREILNTVGKPGKLGGDIRCVVSVAMLTEGWDANNVTHILGVRAFRTPLLCEQVIGRALRRRTHSLNDQGLFDPEYAEIFGIDHQFFPFAECGPAALPAQPRVARVQSLAERLAERPNLAISFPRVVGFRHELPTKPLTIEFGPNHRYVLTPDAVPTLTESNAIVGQSVVHSLAELESRFRVPQIAFELAVTLLQVHYKAGEGDATVGGMTRAAWQAWLFPQLLAASQRWLAECLDASADDVFPQMLLLAELKQQAAALIHSALASQESGQSKLRAILADGDDRGSTDALLPFDTSKPTFATRPEKCHINLVPEDSRWEGQLAFALEDMDEVVAYAKNRNLGFRIPYTRDGITRQYYPDYLLKIDDGRGIADPLHLVLEVTGREFDDKPVKVRAAQDRWVPAINAERSFGRWAFHELRDPHHAKSELRAQIPRWRG